MRLGAAVRPHFVQDHVDSGLGGLPGGFAAGQAATYDMHHTHCGLRFSMGSQRCGNIV